jgi:GT2 family glycosyltransferase
LTILLSAVVSTYKRREGLMRCLDSLEQQTLPRDQYEIIVVDDHSPDDTAEWMATRPAIRYLRQPTNRGLSASRNMGIRNANSDWVLFLDDDLVLMPDVLEKHLQTHREQPGEKVAVLGHTRYAPGTEITPFMDYLWDSGRSPLIDPALVENPNDAPFGFLHTNTSVHRELLIRVGMLDETLPYGEDTELAYRLKQNGMRLVFRADIIADHYGTLSYAYARRRAKIAGRTAILTHRKHPEWINIDFLNYSIKARSVIQARRVVAENILDPLLIAADERRLDHPLLRRAYRFALGTHQLTAMLDQVHQN